MNRGGTSLAVEPETPAAAGGAVGADAPELPLVRRAAPVKPFDGSKLLSIYIALLVLIPSNLAISVLGAAGSPANIFGVFLFARWLVALTQGATPGGRRLLRGALVFYAMAVLASYLVANMRVMTQIELNGADRGLIRLMSWSGVFLVALDGLPTRRAFRRVIETAAAGGVVLAFLGLVQGTTNFNPADHIHIPGLSPLSLEKLAAPELRNGIPRVYATTSHPIEFATVLVLLIALTAPLALMQPADRRSRLWFVGLIVMGLAFPLAVARSGFLAATTLAVVVIPRLPKRARRRMLLTLPVGLAAVHVLFPSLLGTILDMFSYTANGEEVARTGDYPVVADYVRNRPLFGQGFGTFLAGLYRVLDNEYLLTSVEMGIVGLLAYLWLHIAAIRTAQTTRRASRTVNDKLVCQCLLGAAAAALVSSVTFDSLSFPMFAGFFFLCLALPGAFAAVVAAENAPDEELPPERRPRVRRPTAKATATVGVLCTIGALFGLNAVRTNPTAWISSASAVVTAADLPPRYQFSGPVDTTHLANLVLKMVLSNQVRDEVGRRGYLTDYEVALGSGSLEPGTDVQGDGPLFQVQVQSTNPRLSATTALAVIRKIREELARIQAEGRVVPTQRSVLTAGSLPASTVIEIPSHKRGYVAVILLALGSARILTRNLRDVVKALRQRRQADA